MTIKEAAKRANVHPKTVRRWIESGHLKSEKVQGQNGQEHSIREEDLAAVLEASISAKRPPVKEAAVEDLIKDQAVLEARLMGLEERIKVQEHLVQALERELEQKNDYVRALLATNAKQSEQLALPKPTFWQRLGFKGGDK